MNLRIIALAISALALSGCAAPYYDGYAYDDYGAGYGGYYGG